jgi:N-acetylglucosaminyldiphosphoundecaprenol N-acetyl-beta-D-mannosaminyltransferase
MSGPSTETSQCSSVQTVSLMGYDIFGAGKTRLCERLLECLERSSDMTLVACANPHSLVTARGDREFAQALHDADVLLPDGVGITFALRSFFGTDIDRITGSDLFELLLGMNRSNRPLRHFFLGSSDEVLLAIKSRLAIEEPGVIWAGGYSPPYTAVFSPADNAAMLAAVNAAEPDVLWVGLTAPKQEKWLSANRTLLNVRLGCAVGAVFDYYAGRNKRPAWAARLGVEWLLRLIQEPRRLWRRTFVSSPAFLLAVMKQWFQARRQG